MATLNYQPSAVGPSLLDDFFSPLWQGSRMKDLLRAPEAEVVETQNDIRVVLDTPGMTAEDIDISLENNILTVSGERKSSWTDSDAREATWHISERRYGKFSRSFMLPRDVEQDRIGADFENGVLSITIPKSEKARRRRIEIRAGSNGGSRIESGSQQ